MRKRKRRNKRDGRGGRALFQGSHSSRDHKPDIPRHNYYERWLNFFIEEMRYDESTHSWVPIDYRKKGLKYEFVYYDPRTYWKSEDL